MGINGFLEASAFWPATNANIVSTHSDETQNASDGSESLPEFFAISVYSEDPPGTESAGSLQEGAARKFPCYGHRQGTWAVFKFQDKNLEIIRAFSGFIARRESFDSPQHVWCSSSA